MLEYVFDTETTGLSPESERVVEIGVVEVRDLIPTGRELHLYINPGKPMPAGAQKVHGLSDRFLADKPPFKAVAARFLDFVGDHPIVAHNAKFDQGFLDAELARMDLPPLANPIVDTLALSKQVRKGAGSHKLDAICRQYGISLAKRTKHGALLDAQILAEAYVELRGGRQTALTVEAEQVKRDDLFVRDEALYRDRAFTSRLTPLEAIDHALFLRDHVPGAIWADYLDT